MDLEIFYASFYLVIALALTPWVLLSLAATLSDAGIGFIDEWLLKRLTQTKADTSPVDAPGRLVLISGFFGVVICFFAAIASLFMGPEYTLNVPTDSLRLSMLAGVLEVVWLIPYFYALNRGGAINSTPLFQTIPIFSLVFGLTFFNEIPTTIHIGATVLIIIGAVILNYSPKTKKLDLVTIAMMLGASATISLGYFIFKDATETGNFVASIFGNGLGMTVLSVFIWAFWAPYRIQFNDFVKNVDYRIILIQVANEGLYTISTTAYRLAIVIGPSVMVVSAFNAFHPVFTIMIGWVLAKLGSTEQASKLAGAQIFIKTAAILIIAGGTILIAV